MLITVVVSLENVSPQSVSLANNRWPHHGRCSRHDELGPGPVHADFVRMASNFVQFIFVLLREGRLPEQDPGAEGRKPVSMLHPELG